MSYYNVNREELRQSVATLFQVAINEYGRGLVVENMVDGTSEKTVENGIHYWCDRLQEDRITITQVDQGIARMKKDSQFIKFPPKLRQFIELCRPGPEALKLPSFDDAFQIATGAQSSETVPAALEYAIQKVGHWDLVHADEKTCKEVRDRFDKYYREAIDLAQKGRLVIERAPTLVSSGSQDQQPINMDDELERERAISRLDRMLSRLSKAPS